MLPIQKVVLYKHGVGYFERQGEVEGEASVDLHFKASEMNDVLKSLTTLDLTSGIISSISYESTRPLEKQLEDIDLELSDENAMSGLLSQVKGTRVGVEIGSRNVEGVVVGIETNRRVEAEGIVEQNHLVLLVNSACLQSLNLQEVRHIEFRDAEMKKDLGHLLEVLIGAKKKDLKRLTIFARGEGRRTLLISYIVECPVWKTSYRVLLESEQPSVIQAWALVDNTQDEDWEDVRLSLVAGLPISFVHDLYSPRYKKRPEVRVQEEEAYAPPILEAAECGYLDEDYAPLAEKMETSFASAAPAPPPPPGFGGALPSLAQARARSIEVQTRTVEVGDLFEYEIKNPVTVRRGQSALVPIFGGPFEGRRVAVYNPEIRDKNPMSAILFKNTTGVMLEGGPLTVFENDTYVGESMLETMKPDEERIVPYSVELGCTVGTDHRDQLQDVSFARIEGGCMSLVRYRLRKVTYLVQNKNQQPLDLFIEHRFTRGWSLVHTPDPVETTQSFYRFRLQADPKQVTRFSVTEKGEDSQYFNLQSINSTMLNAWVEARYIDEPTRRELERLLALSTRMAANERRTAEIRHENKEIAADQERQRQNLGALGTTHDEQSLRERYVAEMTQAEDHLKALKTELKKLRDEREQLQREMEAFASLKHEARLTPEEVEP